MITPARGNKLDKQLADMEHRDDNIYRVVLGAEPIEKSIREAGVGGGRPGTPISGKEHRSRRHYPETHEGVDKLRRKVSSNRSRRTKCSIAKKKEEKIVCGDSRYSTGRKQELIGLGLRLRNARSPGVQGEEMHTGVDFAAAIAHRFTQPQTD